MVEESKMTCMDNAYNMGYTDAENGIRKAENPFPPNTVEHTHWLVGYENWVKENFDPG